MRSYRVEIKRYSRKGIIKNTEWNLKQIEVEDIMNMKYKIEDNFINLKYKIKDCMKVILKIVSNNNNNDIDNDISNHTNRSNSNYYEKCKTDSIILIQTSRRLF